MRTALIAAALSALALPAIASASYIEFSGNVAISPVAAVPTVPPATIAAGFQPAFSGTYNYLAPTSSITDGGNEVGLAALSSNPAPPHANANGLGTDIVFGAIAVNANGPTEPFSFDYTFTLNLADYATASSASSLGSATVTVPGHIFGTAGDFAVNLENVYGLPLAGVTVTASDGQQFLVTPNNFTSPGIDNPGTFGLHVQAVVPEPASLSLLALPALALIRRRRA